MKPSKDLLRQTGRLALGVAALVAIMLAVYAALGRFSLAVLGGGLYTGCLAVANFFAMGLTVQGIAERAAEKQREDQELQEFSKQMESRMKLSRSGRMIALLALIIAGIRLLGFEPLATILPVAFAAVAVRALQIIDIKRDASSKGSEES